MLALAASLPVSALGAKPRRRARTDIAPAAVVEPKPEAEPEPVAPEIPPREAFTNCMDNMCRDDVYAEKGRCPCSGEIMRIEKVLASIVDMQNKADMEGAELEALLGGEEGKDSTSDIVAALSGGGAFGNPAASDSFRLGDRAYEKCGALAPKVSGDEKDKWLRSYMNKVDADCTSYSAVLKERTDSLVRYYLQVKKSRAIYDEQEKSRHDAIDDPTLCYMEYEACAKEECGDRFNGCRGALGLRAMLQKCQALNKGKCDSQRLSVLDKLRDFILLELK